MAQLAISKDYFAAYARLPRKAQRKADEFLVKFQQDSTLASIHLEPLHRTVDSMLRSARIGDDYRVILRAPEKGDVYLILWADHHDEAYRWAATKQTAVHPITGSLQIFDAVHATQAVTTAVPEDAAWSSVEPAAEKPELPSLFAVRSDDDLFLAGVPKALIPSVRAVGSDAELDLLLPHLPPEAAEVLTALAAGIALDEALEEVLGRVAAPAAAPVEPLVDVTDVAAALDRETTQRQFRLFDGSLDLDAALKHPLDVWRVFLHPRQRRIATAHTKGPVRVLGGAGTGKTVVALHRAAFLVREVFTKPDDRVLFTTFTANLAEDIRSQLAKLLEPDLLARVEVVHLDKWASQLLRSRGKAVQQAFEEAQREHLENAIEVYGQDGVSPAFYRAEWRDVVQEQGLRTEDEYAMAVRRHRGVPLGRAERRKLWPVFAAYRQGLELAGLVEPLDMIRQARLEVDAQRAEDGGEPRYRSVVVDEAQDFSADALRLIRAIAGPERPDDLFLVGDAHQRIYGRPVSLSSCGIQVRGRRSQTLRLNYRTTGSICRWSLRLLDGVETDDLDDGKADRRGYVSVREGPPPTLRVLASSREEEAAVVQTARTLLAEGAVASHLCVVARTRGPLVDRFGPALERAGLPTVLLDREEPRKDGIRLATMHRVKGLEFPVVFLVGVSRGDVPLSTEDTRSDDPMVASRAQLRERSLLYVAASRARDELHVSATVAASTFVEGLLQTHVSTPPRRRSSTQLRAVKPQTVPPAPPSPSVAPTTAAPAPAPSVSPAWSETRAAALATPIETLNLSARLLNWATRNEVTTLAGIASRTPQELLAEKNMGRTTVKEARSILEAHAGVSWEELLQPSDSDVPLPGPNAAPTFEQAASSGNWDQVRRALSEEQRATPLREMELPTRVRSYADSAGLLTLGELAERSRADLAAFPNMGRKSVLDLVPALKAHFDAIRAESDIAGLGFLEGWKALVQGLDQMPRIILSRRSGLAGEVQTLQELGDTFGITRERIRQLERKGCEQLARRRWAREARSRVDLALRDGAISLASLDTEAWWSGVAAQADVARFVLDAVLEMDAWIVEIDDEPWLSAAKAQVVADARAELRARVEATRFPAPSAVLDELVAPLATLGPALATYLREQLRERAQIDDAGRVLALGDTLKARLLALLRSSPVPIRVDETERILGGRSSFPDEVLHFGKGTIGLRQHIPDFDGWRRRLVPAAVDIVRNGGPERQWSCNEILDELREGEDIPEWLSPWVLAALIKGGSELAYLGRLRVALPEAQESESRLFLHQEIEKLLVDAGEPVPKDLLVEQVRGRMGVSELFLQTVWNRPQFVRVDAERMGLLQRDVPGGAAAVAEAAEHAESLLARRGRGISGYHVHREVALLSDVHASWTEELTGSVLRGDGRFRFSQSGAVGLATWESTRMPTRLELTRSALEEGGGRVSVDAVLSRIEANYGSRPNRASLAGVAMHIGANLDGDWIVKKPVP